MAFIDLYKIDVSNYIEKKGRLSYLSWSYAWAELKKVFPKATYEVIENADGWNYHTDGRYAWVKVKVDNGEGESHTEMLPVMDNTNKSIALERVTAMDTNKAIKRCLAKAIAVAFGLGLYIYNGEDVPEDTITAQKPEPIPLTAVAQPVNVDIPVQWAKRKCEICGKQVEPKIAEQSFKKYGHILCSGECKDKLFFQEN